MTPRTTSEIKAAFDVWVRPYGGWYFGLGFAQHLQKLEEGGAIEFVDGKWKVTQEAKIVVEKYLG